MYLLSGEEASSKLGRAIPAILGHTERHTSQPRAARSRGGTTMKLATLGAAVFVAVSLCGCSAEPSLPRAKPTTTPSQEASSAAPTTTRTPAWQAKFTGEELAAYEAALSRWQDYTQTTNEAWRSGRDTPEVRRKVREYDMQWQATLAVFADSVDRGIRIEQPIQPLWFKPTLIRLNANGTGSVVIEQCTDYRNLVVTQNGNKLPGTKPENRITSFTVFMSKPRNRDWMVAKTQLRDDRPCDA